MLELRHGAGLGVPVAGKIGHPVIHGHPAGGTADLVDGVMDAAIAQNPRREVVDACRMLMNVQAGREASAGIVPPKIQIYVRENLP